MIRNSVEPAPPHAAPASAIPIGNRLAYHLNRSALSIADLSRRTGLQASTLNKIVNGSLSPTVDILWKIANALGVRPGSLLTYGPKTDLMHCPAGQEHQFLSQDGGFVSRTLSSFQCRRPFEFYGVELAPGIIQHFEAHPPGTFENLTVHSGKVEIIVGREPSRTLKSGGWIQFLADVPYSYRNPGAKPAHLYLVLSYQSEARTPR